jgi:hypothetical protein
MSDSAAAPRLEDLASVGTRISWGAILAGTLLALGVYFLLGTLGSAAGLSTSDRMNPTTLQSGTVLWAFLTTIVALFIGGLVTSLFTAGENKTEAVMSGIVMWALLFALLLVLGGAGIRAGFNAMQGMASSAQTASTLSWETGAREAGVPVEKIEDWRRQAGSGDKTVQDPRNQQEVLNAATRISWYAFAGTWLSMLAAAAGALVGAGPTFRIVAVQRPFGRTGSAPTSQGYSRP